MREPVVYQENAELNSNHRDRALFHYSTPTERTSKRRVLVPNPKGTFFGIIFTLC